MDVVINLNSFTNDLYIAYNTGNKEDIKELTEKFDHFVKTNKKETVEKSLTFIKNKEIVKLDTNLNNFFSQF